MKKWCYFLILLLFLPIVSADISLTSSLKASYNIGDSLQLTGSVKEAATLEGILSYSILCDNSTMQLAARYLKLNAN